MTSPIERRLLTTIEEKVGENERVWPVLQEKVVGEGSVFRFHNEEPADIARGPHSFVSFSLVTFQFQKEPHCIFVLKSEH